MNTTKILPHHFLFVVHILFLQKKKEEREKKCYKIKIQET